MDDGDRHGTGPGRELIEDVQLRLPADEGPYRRSALAVTTALPAGAGAVAARPPAQPAAGLRVASCQGPTGGSFSANATGVAPGTCTAPVAVTWLGVTLSANPAMPAHAATVRLTAKATASLTANPVLQ